MELRLRTKRGKFGIPLERPEEAVSALDKFLLRNRIKLTDLQTIDLALDRDPGELSFRIAQAIAEGFALGTGITFRVKRFRTK